MLDHGFSGFFGVSFGASRTPPRPRGRRGARDQRLAGCHLGASARCPNATIFPTGRHSEDPQRDARRSGERALRRGFLGLDAHRVRALSIRNSVGKDRVSVEFHIAHCRNYLGIEQGFARNLENHKLSSVFSERRENDVAQADCGFVCFRSLSGAGVQWGLAVSMKACQWGNGRIGIMGVGAEAWFPWARGKL
jgi:hypothetical protein